MICDRQTDRWKKGHIEVGAPPKNINTRHKTGNNKSILLTKKIILQIASIFLSIEIPITEEAVN